MIVSTSDELHDFIYREFWWIWNLLKSIGLKLIKINDLKLIKILWHLETYWNLERFLNIFYYFVFYYLTIHIISLLLTFHLLVFTTLHVFLNYFLILAMLWMTRYQILIIISIRERSLVLPNMLRSTYSCAIKRILIS